MIISLGHDALLFSISGTGSFICPVAQTGLDIPRPLISQSWTIGGILQRYKSWKKSWNVNLIVIFSNTVHNSMWYVRHVGLPLGQRRTELEYMSAFVRNVRKTIDIIHSLNASQSEKQWTFGQVKNDQSLKVQNIKVFCFVSQDLNTYFLCCHLRTDVSSSN